jgi:hypothetical protein
MFDEKIYKKVAERKENIMHVIYVVYTVNECKATEIPNKH